MEKQRFFAAHTAQKGTLTLKSLLMSTVVTVNLPAGCRHWSIPCPQSHACTVHHLGLVWVEEVKKD